MTALAELTERLRTVKLPPLVGWRRTAASLVVGVFLFAVFLTITFPYDAVRARIASEAENAGLWVRIESMGPAFLGVTARGVRIADRLDGPGPPPQPVVVDRLTLRPSIFPWGVGFSAALFGGEASGAIGTGSAPRLRLKFSKLALRRANMQGLTGVDADGTLSGELSLDVPAGTARGSDPDFSQASGRLRLAGVGLAILGGTVTVPIFNQMTPVDLPPITLGKLDAEMPVERGTGTLKSFRLEGSDLEIQASGTLKLARALGYAEPDVVFRIRANPDFIRRMGMIGGALTALAPDPTDSAFRNAKLTGYLNKPTFRPGR
jgi:type II secretion system protein N